MPMKRDIITLNFFDAKSVGAHVAIRLSSDAKTQFCETEIRLLRSARLELEVFGPKPLLGKRSKMSLLRKAVP